MLVQARCSVMQLLHRPIPIRLKNAITHLLLIHDQHCKHTTVTHWNEFDLLQSYALTTGQHHDTSHTRHSRKHVGGRMNQTLRIMQMPQLPLQFG